VTSPVDGADDARHESPGSGLEGQIPPTRPSGNLGRWVSVIVGVLLLGLIGVLATRAPAGERASDSRLLGRPAPPIDGVTVTGDDFHLDDLRGRWVVVNYFATWCVPCVIEHPELVKFDQRHRVTGDARVVSVVFDDDPAAVRRFFDRHGGDWPVVVDDGSIALSFGVAGVPESYLVDPDGFVVSKIIGGVVADDLEALVAGASAERREQGGGSTGADQ